jgi:mannose-6-phosphate isomerase-like protein (cupin superfamily)
MSAPLNHGARLCPNGVLIRPLSRTSRADLVGRSVWTLADVGDGFGDVTISLARIFTGLLWIEGLPLALTKGCGYFVPPGLLHNAENTGRRDLLVVGITSPGVVPGSYPEVPPVLSDTGRIKDLGQFACPASPGDAPFGAVLVQLSPVPAGAMPVDLRRVDIQAGVTVALTGDVARAWLVLAGRGRVACRAQPAHALDGYATYLAPPGVAATVTSGRNGLSLFEVRYPPAPG